MLSGKRFRLKADTIAIETNGDERIAIHVPAGSVITVESGPRPDDRRLLDVRWDDRKIVMFADDIQNRGELITDVSS
jgi:hypothetical protein